MSSSIICFSISAPLIFWDVYFFWGSGYDMHSRLFIHIPSIYSIDARSIPHLPSDVAQYPVVQPGNSKQATEGVLIAIPLVKDQ